MRADFQRFLELSKAANDAHAAWLRHILTIASGGLALLVAMSPHVPKDGPAKWFLAAAWVFLGLGILAGGAATYAEVSRARRLQSAFGSQLVRDFQETTDPQGMLPISARPAMPFRFCQPVMVLCLMVAVACVVSFAVLRTVG